MNLLDSVMRIVVDNAINVWVWSAMEDMIQTYVGF